MVGRFISIDKDTFIVFIIIATLIALVLYGFNKQIINIYCKINDMSFKCEEELIPVNNIRSASVSITESGGITRYYYSTTTCKCVQQKDSTK